MIAVIDVSGNNLTSLGNALQRLGHTYELTHDPEVVQRASHVILPGVGAASFAMKALRQHGLDKVLPALSQPILGICLGMQLLLEYSEEDNTQCLGLIEGSAQLLTAEEGFPVPHMGWNQLQWHQNSPLQQGLNPNEYLYFVHSYALKCTENTVASCNYKQAFSAIISKGHIFGMQFHPEKSAHTGMVLLNNFLSLGVPC